MRHAIAFGLICAGAAAAHAAVAQEAACRVDTFPLEQRAFGMSKVKPGPPVHLAPQPIGCPGRNPLCRQPPQASVNEIVLTGRPRGGWVCVYRPSLAGGGIAGWMPGSRLAALPLSAAPPLNAWVGHWASGRNTIDIKLDGDMLSGVGHAHWPSVDPLAHPQSGGRKAAKFSARSSPTANRIDFRNGAWNDQTACVVSLVLVDRWLVAEDNSRCGGQNVTFTGVYRRH